MKYLLFALILINNSCRKELSCEKCIGTDFKNATIIYGGNPIWDGCGWLVRIDSTIYHPEVLNPAYLQDQLPVKIIYKIIPGKFSCSKAPLKYAIIQVVSIKR